MATPEEQIVAAISIAGNPAGHPAETHAQAVEFLTKVRRECVQSWRPALTLFVATTEPGRHTWDDTVRLFALTILDDFLDIQHNKGNLDDDAFQTLRDTFLSYLQSEYLYGSAEAKAPFLRNKFSHTLSLLFTSTYETKWQGFFSSIFSLLKPPAESGVVPFNPHVSIFFFRLLIEISSEVADQILKNARSYNAERVVRDTRIRDRVREKDAAAINQAVLTIVAEGKQKLDAIRGDQRTENFGETEEVVDLGVRAFASYVPWIDINLTVTPDTIPLIFSLLSDPSVPIRLATCSTLSNILSKGLKVPEDKLRLIQVLSLGPVLDQLETSTKAGARGTEALESYREGLARVANTLGTELIALCNDTKLPPSEQQTASELLEELLPIAMRFLGDPYDDTSSQVFYVFTDMLSTYKKAKQASPQTHMTTEKLVFLTSFLKVVIEKLKWDPDTSPDDLDQDERAAFESMRKDLRKFIDAVLVLDVDIVTQALSDHAHRVLIEYENGTQLTWVDAELAVYLVYLYGELGTKEKGQGRATFCTAPKAIPKAERKNIDYSEYPLTPQGEMMELLVRSRISAYPHPAVAAQFFETVQRYSDFFKVRKEWVLPALEAFLDSRGVHHPLPNVRRRVFYLFFRFVQSLRIDIEVAHIPSILQAIQDLLTVEVEFPSDFEPPSPPPSHVPQENDFLSQILQLPCVFDSQLHMFEAAGALVSALWSQPEIQANALQTLMNPMLAKLSECLTVPLTGRIENEGDAVTILTVHHTIRALGSIPKGFPEYPNTIPDDYIQPPLAEFRQMSEAILVSMDVMGRHKVVREAARFAFGRIIFAAGPTITVYIPRLMTTLLVYFEPSELVDFIKFISHMAHKIGEPMRDVADQLIAPLTNHVTVLLAQPITGTDGTDDKVTRLETKKEFLNFLNSIMTTRLGGIFISERNAPNLQSFLETILVLATDVGDMASQKLALIFLFKFVTTFGATQSNGATTPAKTNRTTIPVPGIEQFIYNRILLACFTIPSLPAFDPKDAMAVIVLNEVGNLLQGIVKARGDEAVHHIQNVFLPSQNCPPDTAQALVVNIRDMDNKAFRKYFSEFIKSTRPPQ